MPGERFLEIDAARRAKGVSVFGLCRRAGVQPSTWWRASTGKTGDLGVRSRGRLLRALDGLPQLPALPRNRRGQPSITPVYLAFLSVLATRLGFDPEEVRLDPASRDFWKIRALAIYLVSAHFDVRGADLARAIGVSKQVVSWNRRQAEDMRDDPAIDELLGQAGRLLAEAAE